MRQKKEFNFYEYAWYGLCTGLFFVLLAILLGGCREKHKVIQSTVHGRIDTMKAPVYSNIYIVDTLARQRLDIIKKMVSKLQALSPKTRDTAYRQNLFYRGDTTYYAVVRKEKGKTTIYINQQYTDKNYYIYYRGIDTILP